MSGFFNTQVEEYVLASIIDIYSHADAEGKEKIVPCLVSSIETKLNVNLNSTHTKYLRNKLYHLFMTGAQQLWGYPTNSAQTVNWILSYNHGTDSMLHQQNHDEIDSLKQKIKTLHREVNTLKHELDSLTQCYSEKTINKVQFTLAIVSEGLHYEQASRFLQKIGIPHPSKSTFLRTQKQMTQEMESIVEYHLKNIQESLEDNLKASFDGTWDHPRFATRCFGALIELNKGKIIDFFIVLRKNNLTRETTHYKTGITEKYPQGLETEVLRKLASFWFKDTKFKTLFKIPIISTRVFSKNIIIKCLKKLPLIINIRDSQQKLKIL